MLFHTELLKFVILSVLVCAGLSRPSNITKEILDLYGIPSTQSQKELHEKTHTQNVKLNPETSKVEYVTAESVGNEKNSDKNSDVQEFFPGTFIDFVDKLNNDPKHTTTESVKRSGHFKGRKEFEADVSPNSEFKGYYSPLFPGLELTKDEKQRLDSNLQSQFSEIMNMLPHLLLPTYSSQNNITVSKLSPTSENFSPSEASILPLFSSMFAKMFGISLPAPLPIPNLPGMNKGDLGGAQNENSSKVVDLNGQKFVLNTKAEDHPVNPNVRFYFRFMSLRPIIEPTSSFKSNPKMEVQKNPILNFETLSDKGKMERTRGNERDSINKEIAELKGKELYSPEISFNHHMFHKLPETPASESKSPKSLKAEQMSASMSVLDNIERVEPQIKRKGDKTLDISIPIYRKSENGTSEVPKVKDKSKEKMTDSIMLIHPTISDFLLNTKKEIPTVEKQNFNAKDNDKITTETIPILNFEDKNSKNIRTLADNFKDAMKKDRKNHTEKEVKKVEDIENRGKEIGDKALVEDRAKNLYAAKKIFEDGISKQKDLTKYVKENKDLVDGKKQKEDFVQVDKKKKDFSEGDMKKKDFEDYNKKKKDFAEASIKQKDYVLVSQKNKNSEEDMKDKNDDSVEKKLDVSSNIKKQKNDAEILERKKEEITENVKVKDSKIDEIKTDVTKEGKKGNMEVEKKKSVTEDENKSTEIGTEKSVIGKENNVTGVKEDVTDEAKKDVTDEAKKDIIEIGTKKSLTGVEEKNITNSEIKNSATEKNTFENDRRTFPMSTKEVPPFGRK